MTSGKAATAGVRFTTFLEGTPNAVIADTTLGGLRSSRASMLKVPALPALGAKAAAIIDAVVAEEDRKQERGLKCSDHLVNAVLTADGKFKLDEEVVQKARVQLSKIVKCSVWEPTDQDGVKTDNRGHLLHAWAEAAQDPAMAITPWTWLGSPAGITQGLEAATGLFPPGDKVAEFHPDAGAQRSCAG